MTECTCHHDAREYGQLDPSCKAHRPERHTRVYLAGPINGTTDAEMFDWRRDLIDRMPRTEFVDPTRRDYRGMEEWNVEAIVEDDKDDIETCEVLIAYCPKPSVGTSMEVLYAWQLGMRVLLFVPPGAPVSPWLRYHSHGLVNHAAEVESRLITWGLGCCTSETPAVTP